jgi:hypothetical protein
MTRDLVIVFNWSPVKIRTEWNRMEHISSRSMLMMLIYWAKKYGDLSLNEAPHHKDALGSGGIAPLILNLGTRWRWVISFTSRLLYLHTKSPRYPLLKRLRGPHSWSVSGSEEKKKSFYFRCRELIPGRPTRSMKNRKVRLDSSEEVCLEIYSELSGL